MGTRKLYAEDSTEVEVPDEAELKALQEKATKVEELEKKLKEAEEFNGAPADLRKRLKELKAESEVAALKLKKFEETGKTLDDKGQVIDFKPTLTAEEIEARQISVAHKVMVDVEKQKIFTKIPAEKRELVEKYYNKLTHGEQVNISNLGEYIEAAYNAAGLNIQVDPIKRAIANINGKAPSFETKRDDFAESDTGKARAAAMGLSFINNIKK